MKKINKYTTLNPSRNEKTNETIQLKEYKTPKLVNYGTISDLVLALAGIGPDGGNPPPLTFS